MIALSQPVPAAQDRSGLVSVIMSVYAGNTHADIERALLSLARQDYPALEIVLVIDGPVSDQTERAIGRVAASSPQVPIRRLTFATNRGLGPALNEAIRAARGDYLARMDADDESLPERIRVQVEFLEAHQDVDVVGCFIEEVRSGGDVHIASMPLNHESCEKEFVRRDPILHPTAMFRRRFFEKAGLYPPEICDDQALWLSAMKSGCRFANIPSPRYRMYLDERFFARRKDRRWMWQVFLMRLRTAREMRFGIPGYLWAVARLLAMCLPTPLLKAAYRHRHRVFSVEHSPR